MGRLAPVLLALAAVLLVAAALAGGGSGPESSPSVGRVFTPPGSKDPAVLGRVGVRVAREFATAYLSWEVGQASPSQARLLRTYATEELAKASFDMPPRLPETLAAQPLARLVDLDVHPDSSDPDALLVVARIERRGQRDRFGLTVQLDASALPRISQLVPPYGTNGGLVDDD